MKLQILEPQARKLITEDFRAGKLFQPFDKHLKSFPREIDLGPLMAVLQKAMDKFSPDPKASDGWLAPRVHAALRLNRREASLRAVWEFLAVVAFPDYVRWRWGSDGPAEPERFIGPEYKQAFARLWWGAEFTRNGESYKWTSTLFANQDFQNSWARLDLFHHRAASIAAARYLSTFNGGKMATSDQVRQLVTGFNMVLTTTMLDAVAPDSGVDVEAVREWCKETPDETKLINFEPEGPSEAAVPEDSILAVEGLLKHAAEVTTFFRRDRMKKAQ